MRTIKIIQKALFLMTAASLLPAWAFGQTLPSSGTWNATTISSNVVVELTGDVIIAGTIVIDGNATLTINNRANKEVKIERTSDIVMFDVNTDGNLIIVGTNGGKIIIDGGAGFTWDDTKWNDRKKDSWEDCGYGTTKYTPLTSSVGPKTDSMIKSHGNIDFTHVRIEQFNAGKNSQSALYIAGNSTQKCGTTTLKNCEITLCSSEEGSAIYVGNQDGHAKNNNESCALTLEDVTIHRCMVDPTHDAGKVGGNAWGGVIRFRGKSTGSLKMTRCTMKQNYSTGDGSCLWWNAGGKNETPPKLILNGCTFEDNRADRDAGAVRLESGFEFEGEQTVFKNNSCGRYGGAIQVADYNGGSGNVKVDSFNYNLTQHLEVQENFAGEAGGGIAFYYIASDLESGFTFNVNLNGLKVTKNKAVERGGGIIFTDLRENSDSTTYNFNVYMESGNISENSAGKAGGGIFARKFEIKSISVDNLITISNNTVTAAERVEDGGVGGGGGIALYDGTMNLESCNISGNTVTALNNEETALRGYGGGILLNRSEFTLNGNNAISNNTANVGGGVAVLNTTAEQKTVQLNGGIINGNTAHIAGGGVGVVGNTHVTINGIDITDNTAANGGGLYAQGPGTSYVLNGTATINYMGGQITRNTAKSENKLENATAKGKEINNISGMGGGICVGGRATLALLVSNRSFLGIQGNTAVNGGDDLFCNGAENTKLVLPNVASMTIEDGNRLFWVEDYITNDTEYKEGTAINGSWNNDNMRYREAMEAYQKDKVFRLSQRINGQPKYAFDKVYEGSDGIYEIFENKYLCLTLGEVFTNIILEKTGMEKRDNAIFKIYRWEQKRGEKIPSEEELGKYLYMTLILTDGDANPSDSPRRKQIEVDFGYYYYVVETPWSWAYDTTSPSGTDNPKLIGKDAAADPQSRTFTFTNTPKDDTPKHAESVKVNNMPN